MVNHRDEQLFAVAADFKQGLGGAVVDRFDRADGAEALVLDRKTNDFVEVKFVAFELGQHLEWKIHGASDDFVGIGLAIDVLEFDAQQFAFVQVALLNKKWNQIFVELNKN